MKDSQRETLPGLAVGAVAERPDAEMDNMRTSGVAVEDLKQEEVGRGGGGVEDSIPPGVS